MNNLDIRDAFFGEIYKLAKKDNGLIIISDDMDAFVLRKFKKELPNQYINIGVAEQNMMDVAAGLASMGKKVFVFGICSYVTMRAFEQIKFSICSMNLPVTIVGVGTGFSFPFDGSTHHGITDIALMRTLPEMEIYNPSTSISSKHIASLAYKSKRPAYVRLDKGVFGEIYKKNDDFKKGYKIVTRGFARTIISTGYMTHKTTLLLGNSRKKFHKTGVVDVFRLKPFNLEIVDEVLRKTKTIISLEENSAVGGLGAILEEIILEKGLKVKFKKVALKDEQLMLYGSRDYLLEKNKIDLAFISKAVFQKN